jgi:hypothetical protein
MKRIIALLLMMLLIVATLPAAAEEKPTDLQFLGRYASLLAVLGEGYSGNVKVADGKLQDKYYVTEFDDCMILTTAMGGTVTHASIDFLGEGIEKSKALAFLLAADMTFTPDADTETAVIFARSDLLTLIDDAVDGKTVEHAGYDLSYIKLDLGSRLLLQIGS